jgi:hypothetical protein
VIGGTYSASGAISEKSGIVFLFLGTYANWQANHTYALNTIIANGFGRLQKVTTAGTSNSFAQPFSTTTTGQTTSDNGMVWTDIGPAALSMTLAAPTSGTNDGYLLRIMALDVLPHRVAISGGANFSTLNFTQGAGTPSYDSITFLAYQGKWYKVKEATTGVTFS